MNPLALLRAMRPQQWVKNTFVLAALVFAHGDSERAGWTADDLEDVWASLFAFAAFCLGSSAIYLINDVMDVKSDRAHPTKCKRAIAAGDLAIPAALVAFVGCMLAALGLGMQAGENARGVTGVVAVYMALNFAYSIKLKHIVLVDAFCIAGGFLLRVKAGGLAISAQVSNWMLLCTLFLALFLALCKRRAESDLLGAGRGEHRAILNEYNRAFLDQMVTVLAACAILSYALYAISEDTVERFGQNLVWTVPFVVFGVARYLFLVETGKGGGSPTKVLMGGDLAFAVNTVGWVTLVFLIVTRIL